MRKYEPFAKGTIVSYSDGPTALMRIVSILESDIPYYYGDHCLGGACSASHLQCKPATEEQINLFNEKRAENLAQRSLAPSNTKANIAECKEIAKRRDSQAVVILRVEDDGTITLSTYGEDKHKCDVIGEWAHNTLKDFPRVPFETVFGWGNKGEPKGLETREFMGLSAGGKAYYNRVAPKHLRVELAHE